MPDDLLKHLEKVWVSGQQLRISRAGEAAPSFAKPAFDKPAARGAGMRAEKPARKEHSADEVMVEHAAPPKKERTGRKGDTGMQAYRIEVGHAHGVKPANIVGAIANEAGLDAKYIGRIEIFDDHSMLDLPDGMPKEVFEQLQSVSVAGQQLRISHVGAPLVDDKSGGKKISLSAPKKGRDRRVSEKKFGDKVPFKGAGAGNRDGAKTKPKAHRKGGKVG